MTLLTLLLLLLPSLSIAAPAPQFQAWASRQKAPEQHPERAENWDFAATLFQRVATLSAEQPEVVKAELLGRSVEKRPIWAFRVRDPGTEVRQKVLIFANLHALEWIGAEVAVALLEELAAAPPPHVEVVVVPLANPDGRYRAEYDLEHEQVRTYRRGNANEVDLNRDFAVHRESDNLWSKLPFTRRYYYSSPGPLSQPESQLLDTLASEGFDASVSLHSFGGYILVPWAGLYERTPDHARLVALGTLMAEAMPGRPYRVIQLTHYAHFFRALGSELDHMYAVHGADSFLIELTRSGIQLGDPSTWRDYFRWYNPVDPQADIDDGVQALLTLVRHLSFEARAPGTPTPGSALPDATEVSHPEPAQAP